MCIDNAYSNFLVALFMLFKFYDKKLYIIVKNCAYIRHIIVMDVRFFRYMVTNYVYFSILQHCIIMVHWENFLVIFGCMLKHAKENFCNMFIFRQKEILFEINMWSKINNKFTSSENKSSGYLYKSLVSNEEEFSCPFIALNQSELKLATEIQNITICFLTFSF